MFISVEMEPQFELKISVLGLKVKFLPYEMRGRPRLDSHWRRKQLTSLNRSVTSEMQNASWGASVASDSCGDGNLAYYQHSADFV